MTDDASEAALVNEQDLSGLVATAHGPLVLEVGIAEGTASGLALPLLDTICDCFGRRVQLCKIDANQSTRLCREYGVARVPTILVFSQGLLVGRFSHRSTEAEVMACIASCLEEYESAQPAGGGAADDTPLSKRRQIGLEFDRSGQHEEGSVSMLDFRLRNQSEETLRDLDIAISSRLFERRAVCVPVLPPGEACEFYVEIEPDRSGRAVAQVELRGPDLCRHLSKIRGSFRVHVARPGASGSAQSSEMHVIARYVVADQISAGHRGAEEAPQRADDGPDWQAISLEPMEIPFPRPLADAYEEFLAGHEDAVVFEGQRRGSFAGRQPKDSWASRALQRVAEHQPCAFEESPEGIYRLEFFEREGGKYLVIAYEKQGRSAFVSHWRTNDAAYAERYPDVFSCPD